MKAPKFRYLRPRTLAEALDALARLPGRATPLAGGQSLLPALNMRVSAPEVLVDISLLPELRGIRDEAGAIRIGAATRYVEIMRDPLVRRHVPLLPEALEHVAHVAIRNKGTLGGSLALADPAAEMPACAVALAATVNLVSANGRRSVAAEDFFTGTMSTAMEAGELIEAVVFPKPPEGTVCAIDELARRRGDYAMAGIAVQATRSMKKLRVAYFGCTSHARLAPSVAAALEGKAADLDGAVMAGIDPSDTPGCTAQTKRRLAAVLTRRMAATLKDKAAA